MNSKQRFLGTLNYEGFDRPPVKYYGNHEVNMDLMKRLNVDTYEELLIKLGDDFRHVYPKFIGPERKRFDDGTWEGLWGERYVSLSFGAGAYNEPVYMPFKDIEDVAELDKFTFPSADWYDYSEIKALCEKNKDYVICMQDTSNPDLINGIAFTRGVEQVLLDIALEDPVYLELMERRFNFYYEMNKSILEAGEGMIDVMCMGDDFGSQTGLLISPASFDKLFAPKLKALYDLAHKYGAKTMMHCCGSNRQLIPLFIELGLDILEVIQVDAQGMDIEGLHRDFYGKIAFCGSISVQSTLPLGSVEDVVREVELRKKLYGNGGMIIAPTHNVQAGTPVENILALYRTAGSLKE